jgi:uncharacterized surface protein with fasciclin (FAS1) repeats
MINMTMNTRTLTAALVIAGAAIAAPAAAAAQAAPPAPGNIVAVAQSAGSFQTLLAAAAAAGLVETLSGPGPFTVFAPTDEAFAKLPAGTVEALLQDREKLAAILKYHVVPGRVMAADVIAAGTATPATVQGQTLNIRVMNGMVHINGGMVVMADVTASNGVIHVIDTVLLPSN